MRITPTLLSACLLLCLWMPAAAGGQNWPSFRGESAAGIADDQGLPVSWDVESGRNLRWRAAVPGLAHSSPVVWGDRVFLIAAAAAEGDSRLVLGDKGGISLDDDGGVEFSWRMLSVDKSSGKVLWDREVFHGKPRARRHVKSSQANSTPATNGKVVVGIFGSQGMAAFDLDGHELWRADLGVLDPGLFGSDDSQWGYASSPVIWEDRVFVQVDRHHDSFLAAYDLANGAEIWRVQRDEKPVWASPTLYDGPQGAELIVVGGDYDRGYDPRTGRELWRFPRDYEVKTPTPVVAGDKIVLAGGYRGRPVYALRTGGRGDLGAADDGENAPLAWQSEPGGPYTSTPVVYQDRVYFVRDTGILTVLDLADGEMVYRQRLDSTYSASPVASDDKIYLTGEEGVVRVVAAGDRFEMLGESDMGAPCMASPAISDGLLLLRCGGHLFAIGAVAGDAGEVSP